MSEESLDPREREIEGILRRIGPDRAPERCPVPRAMRKEAPIRHRIFRAAAAAFLTAVLGASFLLLRSAGRPEPVRHIPAGVSVPGDGREGEIAAGADGPFRVSLPDGSRFEIASGSRISFDQPGPGERVRVRLHAGTLAGDVIKGKGAVRIVAGAGTVTVVGTWFRVKAFRMHDLRAEGTATVTPVLAVEVEEGIVELAGAGGRVPVPAGRRGIILGNTFPVLQERKMQRWEEAIAGMGDAWREPGFASGRVAATLLAGEWEGLSGSGNWRAALSDPGAASSSRRLAAFLVGLSAETSDAARLMDLCAREGDPEVRAILRPHLERIAGEDAVSGTWKDHGK